MQSRLGSSHGAALFKCVPDKLAIPFSTEADSKLHALCEDGDGSRTDVVVCLEHRRFKLVERERGPDPVELNDETLGDAPDLFDWRQVGGIRWPALQQRHAFRLKQSLCFSRRMTGRPVLLEQGAAGLSEELQDLVRLQQLHAAVGVHPIGALQQPRFLVAQNASPDHEGLEELVRLHVDRVPSANPLHHGIVWGRGKTGFICEHDDRPVLVLVSATERQSGLNMALLQSMPVPERPVRELQVMADAVDRRLARPQQVREVSVRDGTVPSRDGVDKPNESLIVSHWVASFSPRSMQRLFLGDGIPHGPDSVGPTVELLFQIADGQPTLTSPCQKEVQRQDGLLCVWVGEKLMREKAWSTS